MLMVIIGSPTKAPNTSPFCLSGCASRSFMIPKYAAPATTPMKKNCRIATIFSAVLAVSATLIPKSSNDSIIMSMPKVTSPPGRTRVAQSNRS